MNTSVIDQYAIITSEWNDSLQKQALCSIMRSKILNSPVLQIESAVCLGLGSLEHCQIRAPSAKISSREEFEDSVVPDSWTDEISSEEEDEPTPETNNKFQKVRNQSLYQLVILETVLEYLREKFKLLRVYLQDPRFSPSDIHFLEWRGYTVVPYTLAHDNDKTPTDPVMLEHITSSTFLFAPFLDIPIVVDAICTGKPSLLLSGDPLEILAYPIFSLLPIHLHDVFETTVSSCEFRKIPELGYELFGFTWPLILNNEQSLSKFQRRLYRAEQAKQRRSRWSRNSNSASAQELLEVGAMATPP